MTILSSLAFGCRVAAFFSFFEAWYWEWHGNYARAAAAIDFAIWGWLMADGIKEKR